MSDVNLPDLKLKLWTTMREDLFRHVPALQDSTKLLCPICCRALDYEKFSLEHILPQQAVKQDPRSVRDAINKNERSGLTLLCRERLIIKGSHYENGCNGWKGRNYDARISDLLNRSDDSFQFSDGHLIALLTVGYLGLFKKYGYRVGLTESGLRLRNQFFNPRRFTKHLPLESQMVLSGKPETNYLPDRHTYWSDPVKIYVDADRATIVIRNYSILLPLSFDPRIPLVKTLAYAPRKHIFRPDLRLAF